jgi:hypothetical protein
MILRLASLSASLLLLGGTVEAQSPSSAAMMEAVRAKLRPCWAPPIRGATMAVVELRVQMRPDGTPSGTEIVDKKRYESDPDFRASADRALRAVMNPRCQPWPFDPALYSQWKVITFKFDPRDY